MQWRLFPGYHLISWQTADTHGVCCCAPCQEAAPPYTAQGETQQQNSEQKLRSQLSCGDAPVARCCAPQPPSVFPAAACLGRHTALHRGCPQTGEPPVIVVGVLCCVWRCCEVCMQIFICWKDDVSKKLRACACTPAERWSAVGTWFE